MRPALPELAVADVDLVQTIAGHTWQWPVVINAMTGGSPTTGKLNAQLGKLAVRTGLAVASGSESILAVEPEQAATFTPLRDENSRGVVIANVGADKPVAVAQTSVSTLGADMLEVHLNAVQELVMPEGGRDFHWADNIAHMRAAVDVPLIVKEVGAGMRSMILRCWPGWASSTSMSAAVAAPTLPKLKMSVVTNSRPVTSPTYSTLGKPRLNPFWRLKVMTHRACTYGQRVACGPPWTWSWPYG